MSDAIKVERTFGSRRTQPEMRAGRAREDLNGSVIATAGLHTDQSINHSRQGCILKFVRASNVDRE